MSTGVEFQEGDNRADIYNKFQQKGSGSGRWLINSGIAKDDAQANGIMIGIVVVVLILTAFVIFKYLL